MINVHDLINLPGAGKAEKDVRKAGKWQQSAKEVLWSIHDYECSDKVNNKIDEAITILEALEAEQ